MGMSKKDFKAIAKELRYEMSGVTEWDRGYIAAVESVMLACRKINENFDIEEFRRAVYGEGEHE